MDSLRTDSKGEGEAREINHHGKKIKVGTEAEEEVKDKTIKVTPVSTEERNISLIHRNEVLELQVGQTMSLWIL